MKIKTIVTATVFIAVLVLTRPGQARESWPPPTEAIKRAAEALGINTKQQVVSDDRAASRRMGEEGQAVHSVGVPSRRISAGAVPAFPGAEGGGKFSFGGRGGKVFVVTNLADSGPGTLREACESAGPRIVVFNVAGIIHLQKPIYIEAPYITIDGHTAPGDGVCIAANGIMDNAHDVVIRYLRLRRGNLDIFNRHGDALRQSDWQHHHGPRLGELGQGSEH